MTNDSETKDSLLDPAAAAAAFDGFVATRAPWLTVRPEAPEDAPFLRALFLADHPLAALLPPVMLEQQADIRMAAFRDGHPGAMRRIFESGAAPIGRVIIDWSAPDGSLCVDLAVAPAHRRRGVAGAALEAWKAAADARGLRCALTVLADNPARALYARHGFVEAPGQEGEAGVRMIRAAPAEREQGLPSIDSRC
ncbi:MULTISPECIES: GNAT family N-acetyltransferase [Methylosinus]|nr:MULTISPECIES: GNAT family N-acetyltransferase [Methylosinus]OBS52140.1 hypothetical protein A8B73_12565 [Methylosinus sp. 3S-1]